MSYTYIPNSKYMLCIRVLNIPINSINVLLCHVNCKMSISLFLAENNKSIVQDCIVRMIEPDPMKRETAGELLKAFQTAEQ